jgi:hypothetical protein
MHNTIAIPIIFYHKGTKEYYRGTIVNIQFKSNMYDVVYLEPLRYKTFA